MISLIIHAYWNILLLVGGSALLLFLFGVYFILRFTRHSVAEVKLPTTVSDVSAISDNDVFATQLDLAWAYVETGDKQLAQAILKRVMREGGAEYRQQAEMLLAKL